MNWKFWQIGKANAQIERLQESLVEVGGAIKHTPVHLLDPDWPAKRLAFLDRLGNTTENDALLTGVLGTIDQELLLQIQKCESPNITESEAVSLCGRIGLLVGLRADLWNKWREQMAKRVNAKTSQPPMSGP